MATVTMKVCDMCTEEQTVAVDTAHFAQDGVDYSMDLCAAHKKDWESLEASRREFAAHATAQSEIVAPGPATARSRVKDTPARREENREVRAWAKQQDIELGDRGRIPEDIRDAFRKWKWEQNHPVPAPVVERPVPQPPRTPAPPADNGEGRQRMDPMSAMATHSDSRY